MMLRNVGALFEFEIFHEILIVLEHGFIYNLGLSSIVRMIPSEQHVLNSFWHLALMHFTNLFQFIVKIKDIWTATKARFLCKVLATWRDVKV